MLWFGLEHTGCVSNDEGSCSRCAFCDMVMVAISVRGKLPKAGNVQNAATAS